MDLRRDDGLLDENWKSIGASVDLNCEGGASLPADSSCSVG